MAKLILWKVGEKATGRYASFDKRCWPAAHYNGSAQNIAVLIYCDEGYSPHLVRTGQHKPLVIRVAKWIDREDKPGVQTFKWMTLTRPAATLAEAKARAEAFLLANPDWHPKEK